VGLRSARAPIAGLALTSTILFLLGALLASHARGAWVEPIQISPAGVASSDPQVAMDASGNLTAVWTSGVEGSREIRSAYRPAGGPWEPSSSRISSAGVNCEQPRLAVSPSGATVLVGDCGSGSATMQAAYRPAGGGWATAVGVPGSGNGEEPRVAIDDAGNAVAVWAGAASTVQSAYRPVATGTWVAGGQISTAAKLAFNPNVAMSPAGYAYALWREKREGPAIGDPVIHVMLSHKFHGGAWSGPSPLTLDTGSTAVKPVTKGEPQIDVNADADRMMAWSTVATRDFMQARTAFTDLSSVSTAEPIEEASAHVELPQIAIDANGLGVATWRSEATGVLLVKAATNSSLGGAWSAPATLGGPDGMTFATAPDAAAGPAGAATVVWRAGVTARAAKRTGPGAFSPEVPISNAAHAGFGEPQVTMSDGGDSVAAWSSSGTSPLHIAITVDDVTPPALSAIVTPAAVEVGAAAPMSAAATDLWSSSTVAWDFGDGTPATGGSVSHAYAAPGDRTVTITATDAVGNTTSQTRAISVTPRPSELPPGGGGGGDNGGGTQKRTIALTASVPRQAWKKIKKARAIRLLCGLDVAGTCSVKASVTRAVAKRLGLKVGKGEKTANVGSGSVAVRAGDEPGTLKAKLSAKARAAIEIATKPVPIVLTVTGSAPGSEPATLSRTLRVKRP
jgi:PKD repeat protein